MAKFEVLILPIDKVENHPNADRLSLNHIRGYVVISNKQDTGSHRYKAGQRVAHVPLNSIVPDSLLKKRGYWDDAKDKGFLGGERGNIVRPINLRGLVSHGLIFPTTSQKFISDEITQEEDITHYYIENGDGWTRNVRIGDDVAAFLGIKPVVSPYLATLWGDKTPDPIHYEVEDLKKYPNLLKGHQVVVTELLHGILCVVGYDRRMPDPFFVADGFRFHNHVVSKASSNIYTEMATPIWEDIKRYITEMPAVEKFYIFGEIIGPGIQDITYGLEKPEFRALDIQMGLMGSGRDSIPFGFLGIKKYDLFKWLNLVAAPILWGGRFNRIDIDQLTDGPANIGGGLRKGVVITSEDENMVDGRRPILKNISNKYLLRTKGTEYK